MGLTTGERGILAVSIAALALMLAVFALRSLPAGPLADLPPATIETTAGTSIPEEDRVNINTATLEELMTLPNVGEGRAQAILAYREEHGPFRYPEELIQVSGIGEGILEGLLDYVTTGG